MRALEGGRLQPRREPSGEPNPANTTVWTSSLQNWEETHFWCFVPAPNLWCFVMTALANSCQAHAEDGKEAQKAARARSD